MTSKVIEKYYRPHLWVYGVSGLMLVAAGGLWMMPRFDAWIMARRSAEVAAAKTAPVVDPMLANLEQEAASYEVWLEKEPDNEKALRGLIETRLKLNDIAGVAAPLEGLARLRGDTPDYLILLGQVKQEAKDYEGSAAAFKKILLTDPTHIKALQGIVDLMLTQNRPEGAIGLLQTTLKEMGKLQADQTIQIDPEKVTSIQLMLGQVYVDQKRFTEAIAIYDQATAINKIDFRPVLAKAIVLRDQGKESVARPFFITAITLAPAKYKDQIKNMAVLDQAELKAIDDLEAAPSKDGTATTKSSTTSPDKSVPAETIPTTP